MSTFGDDTTAYRRCLVNHEFGHATAVRDGLSRYSSADQPPATMVWNRQPSAVRTSRSP